MIHACRLWLKVITVVSLVGLAVGNGNGYQNSYQGELMVECPSGYGLSTVESSYVTGVKKRNAQGDRLWYWGCVKVLIYAIMHTQHYKIDGPWCTNCALTLERSQHNVYCPIIVGQLL